jgi:predicted phage baseplate assembly protein
MDEPRMVCLDDRRRTAVREDGRVNGIDYIEVETGEGDRPELHVFLLGSLPPEGAADWLVEENIAIEPEGLHVTGLEHHHAKDDERDDWIVIALDAPGGHWPYRLRLTGTAEHPLDDLDPRYASAPFSFVPDAPAELDCLVPTACPPEPSQTPDLNYLAKDYASFRQLLLDRLAVTLPDWRDHHSPDLYLTIIEILAYHADHLSYAQDAVATEAYLDTARLRTSVRRHVRLVDYAMHEGCNARAWVCLEVDGNPSIQADQVQFLTRPDGVAPNVAILLPDALADIARKSPEASYEVFEPLPEMGWEEVAERDIERPREMARRILTENSAGMNAIRAVLPGDIGADLARAGEADEDLPRLLAALVAFLDQLLNDPGLAFTGGGAALASRQYGSPNALRGVSLRRINRCKLQDIFPEEMLQPARYRFYEAHNAIPFYTWKQTECCLPKGTTTATLRDAWLDEDHRRRALEHLRVGDVLIFEERVNPRTGNAADVDPEHRHAVRLTAVRPGIDPLGNVPIVEIEWHEEDALPFALTLSAIGPPPECALLEDLTVARGNVVLVDHGETVREPDPAELRDGARTLLAVPFAPPYDVVPAREVEMCCVGERRLAEGPVLAGRYTPRLAKHPVVFAQQLPAQPRAASRVLDQDVRKARPQAALFSPIDRPRPGMDVWERITDPFMIRAQTCLYERWHPRTDLLGSDADDRHFVVEVDDREVAHIRFGDGELGARPVADTRYLAWYRVGGGPAGNVGREAISTMLLRGDKPGGDIVRVWNPLPARGGTAPDRVANVRLHAPHAFRTNLQRAVTTEDYAAIALRDFPDRVQRAAARDLGPDDNRTSILLTLDLLGTNADDPEFRGRVRDHMKRYVRIGHELRVRQVEYVPIVLAMSIYLAPHHQRGAVLRAVRDRFSNTIRPDGGYGFFHPDQLTFGQEIAVSAIVAAALDIPGVAHVFVSRLQRRGFGDPKMPMNDVLEMEPWQIARLDNDPNRPGNGVLRLAIEETP